MKRLRGVKTIICVINISLMKKALLISGLLAVSGVAAQAFEEPKTYPGASFQGISPNGNYLASSVFGTVVIYDLTTGVAHEYVGNEYGDPNYTEGLGNYLSNDGVVLGSTSSNSNASYWQNGEWLSLDTEGVVGVSNLANGITPDGARICGSLGIAPISVEHDQTMLSPVYWDRQADGTYGKYTALPYPTLDFTGRAPQYVTANWISDDGKTIGGQIVDCAGFVCVPIVYLQDEKGDWSYKILLKDLFYPEDVTIPPYPGDGPSYPSAESFMDEEEKAAYDKAYQDYVDSGYDWELYPNEADFLNEEHKAAFEAALAEYNEKFAEWQAASDKFYEAYYQVIDNAPAFDFNDLRLSADGKTYYSNASVEDNSDPFAWPPASTYTPWLINIADDAVTTLDFGKSMRIASVPNDEVIFTFNGVGTLPMEGYVIKDGTCTDIQDWLGSFSPELKEWLDENMLHEIESYDWESGEFTYEDMFVTGMPIASADLNTVALWNDCPWGMDYAYGYVFNLSAYSGVKDVVSAGKNTVAFDANGNLTVDGELTALYLYDLSGRCVLSAQAPSGSVQCNLPSGVYIVKGCTATGPFSAKIAK